MKIGEEKYLRIRNVLLQGIDEIARDLRYGRKTLLVITLNWLKFASRRRKILGVINWEPMTMNLNKGHTKSQLVEYYNPCGYFDEVHIFAYRDRDFEMSPEVRVHGFSDITSVHELLYLCRKYRVKILRNHIGDYAIHWTPVLTLEAKRKLGIPAIISLHKALPDPHFDRFLFDVISEYDHLCTYDEFLLEETKKQTRAENVSLLINRIDHHLFRRVQGKNGSREFSECRNRIMSVARLCEEHKNFTTLIKAMNGVTDRYPSTMLCIAGDGPDKEVYETLIHNSGLDNNIKLLSFIKQPDVVEYLNCADFFVLVENFGCVGKSMAEALIVGKPVVATSGNGNSILHLRNGFNAKLVPWESRKDPDAVAEAIVYMIEHKSDFDSKAIREDAIRIYNYDYWMNEEASVYKSLMQERYGYE